MSNFPQRFTSPYLKNQSVWKTNDNSVYGYSFDAVSITGRDYNLRNMSRIPHLGYYNETTGEIDYLNRPRLSANIERAKTMPLYEISPEFKEFIYQTTTTNETKYEVTLAEALNYVDSYACDNGLIVDLFQDGDEEYNVDDTLRSIVFGSYASIPFYEMERIIVKEHLMLSEDSKLEQERLDGLVKVKECDFHDGYYLVEQGESEFVERMIFDSVSHEHLGWTTSRGLELFQTPKRWSVGKLAM